MLYGVENHVSFAGNPTGESEFCSCQDTLPGHSTYPAMPSVTFGPHWSRGDY